MAEGTGEEHGLEKILNKAAEYSESTQKISCTNEQTEHKQEDGSEGGGGDSSITIEGLLMELSSKIKSTGWLKENTAEKFLNENPGYVAELMKCDSGSTAKSDNGSTMKSDSVSTVTSDIVSTVKNDNGSTVESDNVSTGKSDS